jgi:hypothetical protein
LVPSLFLSVVSIAFFFSGLGVLEVCFGGTGSVGGGGGEKFEIGVIWGTLLDLRFTDSVLFFVNVAGLAGKAGEGDGLDKSG